MRRAVDHAKTVSTLNEARIEDEFIRNEGVAARALAALAAHPLPLNQSATLSFSSSSSGEDTQEPSSIVEICDVDELSGEEVSYIHINYVLYNTHDCLLLII